MTILGIDPGYDRCGWAILEATPTPKLISCGLIQTSKTTTNSVRLAQLYDELRLLIAQHHPDTLAIESLFLSKNQKTVIGVAQSRGVILLACELAQMKVVEYSPPQIKLAITGSGRADKKGVEKLLRLQLPGLAPKLVDDTIDAVAVAVTHFSHSGSGQNLQ